MANQKMCSLDVSSLFTNVPLIETVDYICQFITINSINLPIQLDTLRELILRCTLGIQFQFNGQFWRQNDGVAMGSPLGPILADIFMSKLERDQLSSVIATFKCYTRFMDDIFVILAEDTNLEDVVSQFNQAHPFIRFTHEVEIDGRFQFLDVGLHKMVDGRLQRTVFRKSTWSGQYTHFQSFVPMQQKRNLVKCLAYRARRICSPETLEEELKFVSSVLRQNGYPDRFIDKYLNEGERKEQVPVASKKLLFMRLPFYGDNAADTVVRRLNSTINHTFPMARLFCSFQCNKLLPIHLKDKIPVHN